MPIEKKIAKTYELSLEPEFKIKTKYEREQSTKTVHVFIVRHEPVYDIMKTEINGIDNKSWLCKDNLQLILDKHAPGGKPFIVQDLEQMNEHLYKMIMEWFST
jgi:hypothetical protein